MISIVSFTLHLIKIKFEQLAKVSPALHFPLSLVISILKLSTYRLFFHISP
jgi:hypothetical protein